MKTSTVKFEIVTRDYEFNYGKKPSGRGSWAFIICDGSCNQEVETVFAPGILTFLEAKKWLKDFINENWTEQLATGYLFVKVGT